MKLIFDQRSINYISFISLKFIEKIKMQIILASSIKYIFLTVVQNSATLNLRTLAGDEKFVEIFSSSCDDSGRQMVANASSSSQHLCKVKDFSKCF